jgi:hypothetical protein
VFAVTGAFMPVQGSVLYPNQGTEFANVGASLAWIETGYSMRQRWKPPVNVTVFADATNGSDTANDCLAATTSACASLSNSFNRIYNYVDLSGGQAQSFLSSTGTFTPGDVLHISGSFPGGSGNAVFTLNGNGTTTIQGGTSACVSTFDHAVVEVSGISCTSSAGCVTAQSGAIVFLLTTISNCTLSGTGGVGISIADTGTKIEFINVGLNYSGATAQALIFTNGGSLTVDTAQAFNINTNVTFSLATVYTQQLSNINLNTVTFGGAGVVTGTRYNCAYFSNIFTNTGNPNTAIPGSVNGANGADCQAH